MTFHSVYINIDFQDLMISQELVFLDINPMILNNTITGTTSQYSLLSSPLIRDRDCCVDTAAQADIVERVDDLSTG